jgi:hypothetical protein
VGGPSATGAPGVGLASSNVRFTSERKEPHDVDSIGRVAPEIRDAIATRAQTRYRLRIRRRYRSSATSLGSKLILRGENAAAGR